MLVACRYRDDSGAIFISILLVWLQPEVGHILIGMGWMLEIEVLE